MRVTVFDASCSPTLTFRLTPRRELQHPWRQRDSDRRPGFPSGVHVDPRDRPGVLVGDKRESPATASQLGFAPTGMDPDRPQRARVETDEVAGRAVGEPDGSVVTTIPTGNPPTWMRVIASVTGSIRSTSPASAAVTQRYPSPAASPSVPPFERRMGGNGTNVEGSGETVCPAGPRAPRGRRRPARHDRPARRTREQQCRPGEIRPGRARRRCASRVRRADAGRILVAHGLDRGNQPLPEAREGGDFPIQVHGPRGRARGEIERRSGRSATGLRGSPFSATQSASGPAAIEPGCPGTGSAAVTPRVVAFSPESRVQAARSRRSQRRRRPR